MRIPERSPPCTWPWAERGRAQWAMKGARKAAAGLPVLTMCTTPVTPTTSSSPSSMRGFSNLGSLSEPHRSAPEPQLPQEEGGACTGQAGPAGPPGPRATRPPGSPAPHLGMLMKMRPSMLGSCTSCRSTCSRISRCRPREWLSFCSPARTYTPLLWNLPEGTRPRSLARNFCLADSSPAPGPACGTCW